MRELRIYNDDRVWEYDADTIAMQVDVVDNPEMEDAKVVLYFHDLWTEEDYQSDWSDRCDWEDPIMLEIDGKEIDNFSLSWERGGKYAKIKY